MSMRDRELQYLIHRYRKKTGIKEVDMKIVAKWAVVQGYQPPKPQDPIDMLAKSLARAARQETRTDEKTQLPYRANHALRIQQDYIQRTLWFDIDEATRSQILKSLINRREQMVGDAYQLTLDTAHWNRSNPTEEPIQIPLDFTDDVEWRKNAPLEDVS